MRIRAFRPSDAPHVAGLYESLFRSGTRTAGRGLTEYFVNIFCNPASTDTATPSLVLVNNDDLPEGFLGVQRRAFLLDGSDVSILVTGPYIVAPEARRGGSGLFLLQRARRYQCDIMLTDGANIAARDIWMALKGQQPESTRQRFLVPFKPLKFLLDRNGFSQRTRWHRWLCTLTGPAVQLIDLLTKRAPAVNATKTGQPQLTRPLLTADMVHIDTLLAATQPGYLTHANSAAYRQWQLTQLGKLLSRGELRAQVVLSQTGEPIGWFIYFRNSDYTSEVIQLQAVFGHETKVLAALCLDASVSGTSGLTGRLQPNFRQALAELAATFHTNRLLTLTYTKQPKLADALSNGRTTFSWLDGEAWLGFANESFSVGDHNPAKAD